MLWLQNVFIGWRARGRTFCNDRRGNVALVFGLSLIPLVGMTGMAIDYTHAASVKATLQSALDATALAVSKTATTQTAAQLQASAQAFFGGVFNAPGTPTPTVKATYTPPGTTNATVVVSATASVPTYFMGLFGINAQTVSGSSTTTWGNTRLRVALALDNTGSMASSGKMTALKSATKSLLGQLQSAAVNTGDVYVSIIPFAKVVNVGTSNYAQTWIDWTAWNAANQTCTWRGVCTPMSHSSDWDGSIMDRNQNNDISNVAPTTSATAFPAAQGTSGDPTPLALMGLSNDWTALNNEVTNMNPSGGTNQAIGIVWAWQSLTAGAPLNAPAEDPTYQYAHDLIILSDGLNTEDRWYGNGSSPAPQVDARQEALCDRIKAAGITIYAIQVDTDGSPTAAALQYCASDPSKFTLLTSASQIAGTFQQIGANLSQLRLTN
jgi:Flp pilus assembly protein TadG